MGPRHHQARATLLDVAAAAGVSRATVSLVLRDSPLVAKKTRTLVQQTMAALGYVYNRSAASLRAHRSKIVGLLIPEIRNPFYADFVAGFDSALDQAGYVAFLANTGESPDREERFLRRMLEQRVDGVVICPAARGESLPLAELRQQRIPCVEVLRHLGNDGVDYVGADYAGGMEQAVDHLVALGHQRIAYIEGNVEHSATTERYSGFAAAMARYELATDLVIRCTLSRSAGAQAVAELSDRRSPPTAIIGFNDIVAFGVMAGLTAAGQHPGADMAVVGMDDVAEAAMALPSLTSISTHSGGVGEEAAKLVLHRLDAPDDPAQRVILPTQLIVRESSGPARGKKASSPRR